MALFTVVLTYIEDKDTIQRVRPAHREHLKAQFAAGRLYLAGPFGDDSGGMAVYDADSEDEVRAILAKDPFTTEGIIIEATVKPWEIVFDASAAAS